jgi:hypothetical protein
MKALQYIYDLFTSTFHGRVPYFFLTHGTRRGWVVSITPRPRFTPGQRAPGTHCTGGWVGPRAGLDVEVRGKILCLCRGSNPGSPVRGQLLYWLMYPAPILTIFFFIITINIAGRFLFSHLRKIHIISQPHVTLSLGLRKEFKLQSDTNMRGRINMFHLKPARNGLF